MATISTTGPLLLSDLSQGDRLVYCGTPSPCLVIGQAYTVHADADGDLHIDCARGMHSLEGHLHGDSDELLHFARAIPQ
jgi:hypothetical protein